MSTTDVEMLGESTPITKTVDLKLEGVVIPVSNVERSKAFYANLSWRLDADFDNGFRVVQFTPLGSGTSIQFGAVGTQRRNRFDHRQRQQGRRRPDREDLGQVITPHPLRSDGSGTSSGFGSWHTDRDGESSPRRTE